MEGTLHGAEEVRKLVLDARELYKQHQFQFTGLPWHGLQRGAISDRLGINFHPRCGACATGVNY